MSAQGVINKFIPQKTKIYLTMLANQVRMDIRSRYLGAILGLFWAVLGPLLWTGIFSFVIVFVLKARLNATASPLDYVLFILCGMIPWMAFQESISNAASSIVYNSNVVKNVPFPMEIFPISGVLISLIGYAVGLVLIVVVLMLSGRPLGVSLLFLPVAIVFQVLFALGFGFFLASLNVFIRDVTYSLTYIFMVILYLSPVIYDVAQLPPGLQKVEWFNPVSHFINMYRDIFINNQIPDLGGLAYLLGFSLVVLFFGYRFFHRTKAHFSDYLV